MQQVQRNDIGGDRHEGESHRAFAGGRIIFLGIDPYENGPAASHEIVRLLWRCGARPQKHARISRVDGHDHRNEASLMT